MKLADALGTLRSTSDQTHKFWGYYQAVTAAAVGFAWASTSPKPVIVGLAFVYAVFAFFNRQLIVSSQKDASAVWEAIQTYTKNPFEPIEEAFKSIPATNQPERPERVGMLHIALSIFAGVAVLARLCFPEAICK